jgi:hypothetical protein
VVSVQSHVVRPRRQDRRQEPCRRSSPPATESGSTSLFSTSTARRGLPGTTADILRSTATPSGSRHRGGGFYLCLRWATTAEPDLRRANSRRSQATGSPAGRTRAGASNKSMRRNIRIPWSTANLGRARLSGGQRQLQPDLDGATATIVSQLGSGTESQPDVGLSCLRPGRSAATIRVAGRRSSSRIGLRWGSAIRAGNRYKQPNMKNDCALTVWTTGTPSTPSGVCKFDLDDRRTGRSSRQAAEPLRSRFNRPDAFTSCGSPGS